MDKKTAMKRLVAGYAAKHGLTENGSRPTWTSADGGPAKCPTPSSARASGKSALVRECIEGMATAKKLQKKRGGGPLPGVICCAVCLKPVSYTHLTLPTIYSV